MFSALRAEFENGGLRAQENPLKPSIPKHVRVFQIQGIGRASLMSHVVPTAAGMKLGILS